MTDKKFSTITDLQAHIEDGMGSQGSHNVASVLTQLLIKEGFFVLEWDGYYSTAKWDKMEDEEFFEIWERADKLNVR